MSKKKKSGLKSNDVAGRRKRHWTAKLFKHIDALGKEVNTICLLDLPKPILDELHKATPSGDFLSQTAIRVLREWADGARTKRQSEAIAELVKMCAESTVLTVGEEGITAEVRRDRDNR